MSFGAQHSRRLTVREWWVLGACALVLALSLFTLAPVSLSEDLASHAPRHHGLTEMVSLDATSPGETADSGFACLLHCGCHQAAPLHVSVNVTPSPKAAGLAYALVAEVPESVVRDRLVRPPRT